MDYHTLNAVRDGLLYGRRDAAEVVEIYPELQEDPVLHHAAMMIRVAEAAIRSRIETLYDQANPDD